MDARAGATPKCGSDLAALSAVRGWEQGRRTPERSARILLKVVDKEPEAVSRALAS